MGLTEFSEIIEETFAIELPDKHVEAAILKMLKNRFPGEYSIAIYKDSLGNLKFNLVFESGEEETYFKLRYG